MCYSATASFTASGVLFLAGAGSVSKSSKSAETIFASIPLIFSAQQLAEGVLWLCLGPMTGQTCQDVSTYLFITFGQSVWPVIFPLATLGLEQNKFRRSILKVLLVIGIFMSASLLYLTANYTAKPSILNGHIHYAFDYPGTFVGRYSFLYLIPTVLPNLISSIKKIQWLGLMLFASFILTKTYYEGSIFSVWCYFAAAISFYIYIIMNSINKEATEAKISASPVT